MLRYVTFPVPYLLGGAVENYRIIKVYAKRVQEFMGFKSHVRVPDLQYRV